MHRQQTVGIAQSAKETGAAAGFRAVVEILQQATRGGWPKKATCLRGDIDCRPSLALRRPCCSIYPRNPCWGAKGQETMR
jgi:hypothetical protein